MGFFEKRDIRLGRMRQRYGWPTFTVLDARSPEWRKRKKRWLDLGLVDRKGREADDEADLNIAYRNTLNAYGKTMRHRYARKELQKNPGILNKNLSQLEHIPQWGDTEFEGATYEGTQTSEFDPVLTEICYDWFAPPKSRILDPFAGGCTRGCIAAIKGHDYLGIDIDIRGTQLESNREIARELGVEPLWVHGDSHKLTDVPELGFEGFDFVFTCPPYWNTEIYASEKEDGSVHKTYKGFMAWYKAVFTQVVAELNSNRFLAVVVAEIRDRRNNREYMGFVADNIKLFQNLGLYYYNELVHITPVGSLTVRAGRYYRATRKIAKQHQHVLVFWKGDLDKIKEVFPDVVESDTE